MRPSDEIFSLAKVAFDDAWNAQNNLIKQDAETIRKDIMLIERKSEQIMDRIVEADGPTLITAYEKKIR